MANKPWHRGAHRRLGNPVITAANADPDYRCPRCGKTYAEVAGKHGAAAAKWIRGHKTASAIARTSSEYQAEHARCSSAEGAAIRNARSSSAYDW